jgi:hypothetical protein
VGGVWAINKSDDQNINSLRPLKRGRGMLVIYYLTWLFGSSSLFFFSSLFISPVFVSTDLFPTHKKRGAKRES